MRIGIDLQPLKRDLFRGINLSAKRTVEAIIRNDADPSDEYILFNSKDIPHSFFEGLRNRKIKLIEDEITPEASSSLDIYHILSFFDLKKKQISPSSLKCRTIVTIYDLIPALFWDHYLINKPKRIRDDYVLRLGEIDSFDSIIAISSSTKNDLKDILGIHRNKISVVKLGIPWDPKHQDRRYEHNNPSYDDISRLKIMYGIRMDYILCTAGMDDRKNMLGLIESFIMLDSSIRAKHQLVIVCKINWPYKKNILEMYDGRIKADEVIFTDFVAEKDLIAMYKNASLFVFPSFYEGFGLPVLEAMASGCPVIASNTSSMPEVAGNTAILVDPYKLSDLTNAMERVLSDRRLAESMRRKGLRKASCFDWDESAKSILKVYRKTSALPPKDAEAAESKRRRSGKSEIKLGVVSVWNTNDGLAAYTSSLLEGLPKDIKTAIFAKESRNLIKEDDGNVIRCWDWDDDLKRLYSEIRHEEPDIVHFQFNFDYFRLDCLMKLIRDLDSEGIKSIMTFHSTDDSGHIVKLADIKEGLRKIDLILVHTRRDMKRLKEMGINNVTFLPMGSTPFRDHGKESARKGIFGSSRIISTFGFPFPHKGTIELIKAMKIVKRRYSDALLLELCSLRPDSTNLKIIREYNKGCKRLAVKLGISNDVLFFTEHLHDLEILELLQASDLVVMPYKPIKDSASGAIRYALASHRPVITTDTNIFSEFDKEVYKIKDHSPKNIAAGIIRLFEDKRLCDEIVKNAERYTEENRWENISKRYEAMLRSLA